MKSNPLTSILLGVLTISALASLALCYLYIRNAGELRALQAQVGFINNRNAAIASLANDAVEYSKKNPAIEPLLESFGMGAKQRAAAGAAPAAPAKTGTR